MNSRLCMLTAALALSLGAGAAAAAANTDPHESCFVSSEWRSWSAPANGDGDVLYLKVNMHEIYRVDLTPGSHARKYPGAFLVNHVWGSDWLCSALDLDLAIADSTGFRQRLIAKSMRKLAPAEVAAIPKKDLP